MVLEDQKKFVVIGDGTCGKTSLLMVYVEREFPREFIPSVFEEHLKEINVDGKPIIAMLVDTCGQEEYNIFRAVQYVDTDVFILCFAIDNRSSFENVTKLWMPEIKRKKCPVVLVGTKSDLREDYLSKNNFISQNEAESLARKIKAVGYVECSAKMFDGVDDVFQKAAKAAVNFKEFRKHNKCIIL